MQYNSLIYFVDLIKVLNNFGVKYAKFGVFVNPDILKKINRLRPNSLN